jgi:hypothetical protein
MREDDLYFLRFLDEAAANLATLFGPLKSPPEGRNDVPGNHFQGVLEARLVQRGEMSAGARCGCANTWFPFAAIQSFTLAAM